MWIFVHQLMLDYLWSVSISSKCVRKSLQVHQSSNGGVFKKRLLALRGELLQSPWILELTALHLNLADSREMSSPVIEGLGEFSCDFESDSPTLFCTVLESARLEFVLNCSICLVRPSSDQSKRILATSSVTRNVKLLC